MQEPRAVASAAADLIARGASANVVAQKLPQSPRRLKK